MERFACPTPDRQGRYHCIDDHVLCDGFIHCPSGEDEDRQACMFYKTVCINIILFIYFKINVEQSFSQFTNHNNDVITVIIVLVLT